MNLKHLIMLPLVAFMGMTARPACAALTYTYVGKPYNATDLSPGGGGYLIAGVNQSLEDEFGPSMTASVTFRNTIKDNYTGTIFSSDIQYLTMTSGNISGKYDFNSNDGFNDYAKHSRFILVNGVITGWTALMDVSNGGRLESYGYRLSSDNFSTGTDLADNSPLYPSQQLGLAAFKEGYGLRSGAQVNFGQYPSAYETGTWTEVSPVPLPSSLPLFSAALLGLVGIGVKSQRKITA